MKLDDLHAFEVEIRKHCPKFRVAFKDESKVQRLIGALMHPLNAYYLTRYTSTFAPVVWFPSRAYYESNPRNSFTILAHEFVHLVDHDSHPWGFFTLTYAFPQILAIFPLYLYLCMARTHAWPLAVMVLGSLVAAWISRFSMAAFFLVLLGTLAGTCCLSVAYAGWATAALVGTLLCLAPWPAWARANWERRGYAMSLACYLWTYKSVPVVLRDAVARAFYGPFYYYMTWGHVGVERWIDETLQRITSGDLLKEGPYRIVHDFVRARKLAV